MKKLVAVFLIFSIVYSICVFFVVKYDVSYYATFENGDTVKVDSIIAVPISSVEQIGKMWPEYHAEINIKIEGKEIILRSKPFLFCDDPKIKGQYAGRNIYCFD